MIKTTRNQIQGKYILIIEDMMIILNIFGISKTVIDIYTMDINIVLLVNFCRF